MSKIILFDYWRSSASYRVRIALWLKGLPFSAVPVDLTMGQQSSAEHLKRQPQGLVPALQVDGKLYTQSLAIIEYIDQLSKQTKLLPENPQERAHVQSLSHLIAMEIHPVCNLKVINHVAKLVDGDSQEIKIAWNQNFIAPGLLALERSLNNSLTGQFCHGDTPGMADCCLIPQLYNARRWGVDYSAHKQICKIEESCRELVAFQSARPDMYKPA